MTRSLDDILIGVLIFFILERIIKLISWAVVEPMFGIEENKEKKGKIWTSGIELVLTIVALLLVIKFQKNLAKLAKVA
jgi:hypothetical protein